MSIVHAGFALATGLSLTDLSGEDLWIRYYGAGGAHTQEELLTYLRGDSHWNDDQHDIAAQALNEYTSDHGMDHPVSYADEL